MMRTDALALLVAATMTAAHAGLAATGDGGARCTRESTASQVILCEGAMNTATVGSDVPITTEPAHAGTALSTRTTCPTRDLLAAERARSRSLPTDLFQRCAVRALRGDFGPLQSWQVVGYSQALAYTPVKRRVWTTTYFSEEGAPRGSQCRWWDAGCSERVASCNEAPGFAFLWCPATGLRQVLDTGADSNDSRARNREGADGWADFWEEHEGILFGDENGGTREVWAVRGRQKAHWKHGEAPEHAWLRY